LLFGYGAATALGNTFSKNLAGCRLRTGRISPNQQMRDKQSL